MVDDNLQQNWSTLHSHSRIVSARPILPCHQTVGGNVREDTIALRGLLAGARWLNAMG